MLTISANAVVCAHCGEVCASVQLRLNNQNFCCEGCKMVYQLINKTGLCDYYALNPNPGINQRFKVRENKFAFLEDPQIGQQLISFSDGTQTHVTFYLPHIHCSSCLYILEHLHQLNEGIITSTVNFNLREVTVVFGQTTNLRAVAELLTAIGYEPYISLNNLQAKKPKTQKGMIYQLGVAGFCFANIMLLSFPEYLGLDQLDPMLQQTFRWLNFVLSLPIIMYSAQPFYKAAWKGLTHRFLNIDAPIVLAILVTFGRSCYEIITSGGSGYFDSMSGIVFFMLIGRVLQNKTYEQLSFDRDYTAYFPIAVSVLKNTEEVITQLPNIQLNDTLLIHNDELIPTDGILTKGRALIDYSFVTGESAPVLKEMGEIVYAGGRQVAGNIEILVMKEVSQSYLTSLWEKDHKETKKGDETASFVHLISQYFTVILFSLAIITAIFWYYNDSSKLWNAVTAMLIVACPCALLLSSTFTNGNILRILGNNHFYLRNAQVIEDIANVNHIVFDKTGTLTTVQSQAIQYDGVPLLESQKVAIATLASQSNHPLNKLLAKHLKPSIKKQLSVLGFKEVAGKGIEGFVDDELYSIGAYSFITGETDYVDNNDTKVFIGHEGKLLGQFIFQNQYRKNIAQLFDKLKFKVDLSIISGDSNGEANNLRKLAGDSATILFQQKPVDKLNYVRTLDNHGQKVMMIGDGLNDAGALTNSLVGVAVAEDCNNFTPASDAIIEAGQLPQLNLYIQLCKANKKIILASLALSIVYNIVGLSFAMQGMLSPMVAAILMPASSLSILLITFGSSNLVAKKLGLFLQDCKPING